VENGANRRDAARARDGEGQAFGEERAKGRPAVRGQRAAVREQGAVEIGDVQNAHRRRGLYSARGVDASRRRAGGRSAETCGSFVGASGAACSPRAAPAPCAVLSSRWEFEISEGTAMRILLGLWLLQAFSAGSAWLAISGESRGEILAWMGLTMGVGLLVALWFWTALRDQRRLGEARQLE